MRAGTAHEQLAEEAADLIYNLLVLLESRVISINKVGEALQQRMKNKN